jgi:hypothetical protein
MKAWNARRNDLIVVCVTVTRGPLATYCSYWYWYRTRDTDVTHSMCYFSCGTLEGRRGVAVLAWHSYLFFRLVAQCVCVFMRGEGYICEGIGKGRHWH